MSSAEVNDFVHFLAAHTAIERICFNGQKAAKIFSDRVSQDIIDNRIQLFTLPSTSPAHAAMRFDEKLELWRNGIAHVNRGN
jgi:G:T/U-mismatch repair DNA glycosylase